MYKYQPWTTFRFHEKCTDISWSDNRNNYDCTLWQSDNECCTDKIHHIACDNHHVYLHFYLDTPRLIIDVILLHIRHNLKPYSIQSQPHLTQISSSPAPFNQSALTQIGPSSQKQISDIAIKITLIAKRSQKKLPLYSSISTNSVELLRSHLSKRKRGDRRRSTQRQTCISVRRMRNKDRGANSLALSIADARARGEYGCWLRRAFDLNCAKGKCHVMRVLVLIQSTVGCL